MTTTKIGMSLRDIYRSADVNRWQIVKTIRQQSLAEHSFLVAVTTARLCKAYKVGPGVEAEALRYALTHDLAEVLTGDIATPVKRLLGHSAMSALHDFEARLLWLPEYPLSATGVSGEARHIVKLADMIEAVAFLHLNAASEHGREIKDRITAQIKNYPEALDVLEEVLYAKQVTMDSVAPNGN